jgi:hypothetical protein
MALSFKEKIEARVKTSSLEREDIEARLLASQPRLV